MFGTYIPYFVLRPESKYGQYFVLKPGSIYGPYFVLRPEVKVWAILCLQASVFRPFLGTVVKNSKKEKFAPVFYLNF